MTKICCISDLHGSYPDLNGGDVLICAGDCTARDRVIDWMEFFDWFKAQDYKHKVLVGGNHDGYLERCISSKDERELLGNGYEDQGFEYLCDSGIEIEGLKIWGSPWTPRFCDWHFMLTRGERIRQKWAMIPDDTNILVTHGPAHGCLDKAKRDNERGYQRVGCADLAMRLQDLKDLKAHVFGHIHEEYGTKEGRYLSVNCALMNERYEFVNKPIILDIL